MTLKVIKLRKSYERFITNSEWLKSMHSFSFGEHRDPDWDYFGKIRVINEDLISPDAGFSMHSHSNMEIITVVIKGAITHRDSLNNLEKINEDEVQVMSAGTGIAHSERNEGNKACKLFQIWIDPNKKNLKPQYKQISVKNIFGENLIIDSLNSKNKKLFINQDISIWRCKYESLKAKNFPSEIKKINWIQIIDGDLSIIDKSNHFDIHLLQGDGMGFEISDPQDVSIYNKKKVDFLLFSMPTF